jgi:hypothetical protein
MTRARASRNSELFCELFVSNFTSPRATPLSAATMKISNSAVPVYTISGSEARPLPEWLIRRRKRCAYSHKMHSTRANIFLGV